MGPRAARTESGRCHVEPRGELPGLVHCRTLRPGRGPALPPLDACPDRFRGTPSGLLRLPRLARIPAEQRQTLRVRDAATPLARLTTCTSDEFLQDALEKLRPGTGLPILVTDGRSLMGVITARDIARIVQRHTLRGTENL
ncbi:CBS domain-containing protein [Streptomyces luteolifulvus]